MEGTVQRVRPKLMTVATMLAGLMPLLWADGSGADVMRRIAAPMIGGLITSAFLTLEIIPVVYTYWRLEQLLWERLESLDVARLGRLQRWTGVQIAGWTVMVLAPLSTLYVTWPGGWLTAVLIAAGAAIIAGTVAYLMERPAASKLVWPEQAAAAA